LYADRPANAAVWSPFVCFEGRGASWRQHRSHLSSGHSVCMAHDVDDGAYFYDSGHCDVVCGEPMKAPSFSYKRPEHLDEALLLLANSDGDVRVLAGGQSLIPMLNMRLSSPSMLVDINRLAALQGIEERPNGIRIGALVRHADV